VFFFSVILSVIDFFFELERYYMECQHADRFGKTYFVDYNQTALDGYIINHKSSTELTEWYNSLVQPERDTVRFLRADDMSTNQQREVWFTENRAIIVSI
jgi:hypothetical protein